MGDEAAAEFFPGGDRAAADFFIAAGQGDAARLRSCLAALVPALEPALRRSLRRQPHAVGRRAEQYVWKLRERVHVKLARCLDPGVKVAGASSWRRGAR